MSPIEFLRGRGEGHCDSRLLRKLEGPRLKENRSFLDFFIDLFIFVMDFCVSFCCFLADENTYGILRYTSAKSDLVWFLVLFLEIFRVVMHSCMLAPKLFGLIIVHSQTTYDYKNLRSYEGTLL